jgi:hypothetical protein
MHLQSSRLLEEPEHCESRSVCFSVVTEKECLMKHAIVEVLITSADGDRVPVGLMNTEQALSLPPEIDIEVSHPAHQAGSTDIFMDRAELQDHVDVTS